MEQNQLLVVEINKFCQWKDLIDNCGMLYKRFLRMVIVLYLQFYTIDHSTELYIKSKELQVQGEVQECQYYFTQIYLPDNFYFPKMAILQIYCNQILILKIGIAYLQKVLSLIKVEILETFLGQ
ncbi:unnamed protein product [Paramecium pentaurelia]|uniref:Uncharacterized protein n=1 Tax=Paramecium pentaurelia TaxID=43138 RepID=A0A8S1VLV7_9CILI|nr:unnamed protein product [Paramecium pentaurelia]